MATLAEGEARITIEYLRNGEEHMFKGVAKGVDIDIDFEPVLTSIEGMMFSGPDIIKRVVLTATLDKNERGTYGRVSKL